MKHLTKIIAVFISTVFFLFTTQLKAQVDTSTTQKLLKYIFQNIDKTQIPTSFLEEYGCPMLPMATFNGTLTDSNRIDMHLWRTLYFQLQTGYTGSSTNPLPTITSVNSTIKQTIADSLPTPIPLIIAQYNTVKSNAFTNNLLSYNSGTNQIADVSGRNESPYDTKNLFAACPNQKQTLTGSETFIVPSSLIWNNTNKSISQLQIDFADGNGFQTLTIGSPISISYTDTGYKKWTIKVTLNDNSVLQCYNDYYVLKAAGTAARYQFSQSIVPAWGIIDSIAGVHRGATVTVNYSRLNNTNTLRKPLIIVEGYDVHRRARSLQGNYSMRDFIKAINEPTNIYDFNSQLDDSAGYDLVFIDFFDGADDIVSNAAIVQEVINRVNANKVNDNRFGNIRQQNVVMGLSMGGLCARYALANMTKNFPATPTETRLLITHDSPHKGANVPLGLQYMIRMLGGVQLFGYNVYDIYPDYDDAINLMNAPATTQLLLYSATSANTFANNTFLNATYQPMITFSPTDPQPTYRFIATANGNECANPLFSPGSTFVNLGAGVSAGIDARFLFFRVPILSYKLAAEVEAYALPNAGSTNKIARVYTINNLKLFGFIDIFKQLYNNTAYAPGNHLAIDGVPGSNYPLLDVQALNQLTNLPTLAASLYVSFPLGPFLSGYFGAYAYNQGVSYSFTFVPVASALDAGSYTTPIFSEKYVNGVNQYYPSTSETFIAQETTPNNSATSNNVHIRFTPRNSRWLFNEMENLANLENCSNECFNPYFISGNNPICTSESYFISGLPRGASVVWTASPRRFVTLTVNANQVTATKTNDGSFTLTATITGACGSTSPLVLTRNLTAGPIPAYIEGPFDPVQNTIMGVAYTGQQYYFVASEYVPESPAPTYIWTLTPPAGSGGSTSLFGGHKIYLYFNDGEGDYILDLAKTTACGTNHTTMVIHVQQNYGFRLSASPNPTSDVLQVTIDNETPQAKALNKDENISIELFDFNSATKRKNWSFKNVQNTFNLSVANLPKGQYIIKVTKGNYKQTKQIIVN